MGPTPYLPLNPEEEQIRLLWLKPGSFTDPIDIHLEPTRLKQPAAPYTALSYAWGSEEVTSQVSIDGWPLPVRINLDCALRHLRDSTKDVILWIDAICINQKNINERNHQVGLMAQIYSGADKVKIWLGPSFDGCDVLFDAMRHRHLPAEEAYRFRSIVKSFSQIEWFQRTWVVQEFSLATKDPELVCGNQVLPWAVFYDVLAYTHFGLEPLHHTYDPPEQSAFDRAVDQIRAAHWDSTDDMLRTADRYRLLQQVRGEVQLPGLRRPRFAAQFHRTSHLRTTDPRDKVFAILGLCEFHPTPTSPQPLVPDYSMTVEEVFTKAMALIIQEDFVYGYPYMPLRSWGTAGDLHLPSWVPDMRRLEDRLEYCCHRVMTGGWQCLRNHIQSTRSRCPEPMAEFLDESRTLLVWGVRHGVVRAALRLPSDTAVSSCRKLVHPISSAQGQEQHERSTPNVSSYWAFEIANFLGSAGLDGTVRGDFLKQLHSMLGRCDHPRTIFVTDTAKLGSSPSPIKKGDIVAGLFGVNYPFILRRFREISTPLYPEEEIYAMAGFAFFENGWEWGHNWDGLPRVTGMGELRQKLGFKRFKIR